MDPGHRASTPDAVQFPRRTPSHLYPRFHTAFPSLAERPNINTAASLRSALKELRELMASCQPQSKAKTLGIISEGKVWT